MAKLGKPEKDTRGVCRLYNNVQIKIVYYEQGYTVAKQKYIMEVKKTAIAEELNYPDSPFVAKNKAVDVDFTVTVQFVKYEYKNENSDGQIPVP